MQNLLKQKMDQLVFYIKICSHHIFLEIIKFIHILTNTKLIVDKKKLKNVIKSTTFEFLRDLERKEKFVESSTQKKGNYVQFFKYGDKENFTKGLPFNIKNEIEISLNSEMKELGYL